MKRALRFLFLIFLILESSTDLQAQWKIGQLYSLVYWGGTPTDHTGTFNVFDPIADTDAAIFDFTGSNNGQEPYGNLIQTKDGLLWGMTPYGGLKGTNASGGVIFRYNLRTKQDTVVYNFNPTDTSLPSTTYATLLYVAKDSCFYGLTSFGGYSGSGTIYKFNPRTFICTKLNSMWGRTVGFYPTSSFIQVNDSMLYATAQNWKGGLPGSILTYNINSGVADTAHVFRGGTNDGKTPRGGLIKATNGLLYGLTMHGGTSGNNGVLYSWDPVLNKETILVNFAGAPNDGATPQQNLYQAKDGFLYGMTSTGGDSNKGTLFKYDIGTNTETVLFSFKVTTGYAPFGDVIQANDGLLYGNTNLGGTHDSGTIFSFDPVLKVEKTLFNYYRIKGVHPYADFLEVMDARDSVANNQCPGDSAGSITIFERGGVGPFTYKWSNGATTSSITGLKYGIDTGTITDSRGIAFTFIDTIGPAPMLVTFTISNPCYGGGSGTASANVSGGLAPFSYTWSNGNTTDTATNLSAGTFTCSVKDANGCPGMGTGTITQAAPLVIDSVHVVKASCYNCYDASITAYVSGGIPSGDTTCYHYLWSNGQGDTSTITNLGADTFALCVTSCYGCGSVCRDTILTGIKRVINSGGSINVYPNPNNGVFTIKWPVVSGQSSVEVYNLLGEKVYSNPFTIHNSQFTIDLSGQPNGVYILRVNSAQAVLTGKIIIQK